MTGPRIRASHAVKTAGQTNEAGQRQAYHSASGGEQRRQRAETAIDALRNGRCELATRYRQKHG